MTAAADVVTLRGGLTIETAVLDALLRAEASGATVRVLQGRLTIAPATAVSVRDRGLLRQHATAVARLLAYRVPVSAARVHGDDAA